MLCLNAPELNSLWLKEQVAETAPTLIFVERLANSKEFNAVDEEKSLKVLIYQKAAKEAAHP